MKKLLSAILALLLVAGMCVSCSDENKGNNDDWKDGYMQEDEEDIDNETVNGETFYFEALDTETVTITGYQGSDDPHTLNIPTTLNGKTVTEIADEAFYYCSKINAINIPSTVTKIGNKAFAGCALVTSLTIPATVTSVGESAFYGCAGLTDLTFADGFAGMIGDCAFMECTKLTEVVIPGTIKIIGAGAFFGCAALETVTVSEGVELIGTQAFQNCTKLATLTLPASVQSIGSYAFEGCEDSITTINVPENCVAKTYVDQYLKVEEEVTTAA